MLVSYDWDRLCAIIEMSCGLCEVYEGSMQVVGEAGAANCRLPGGSPVCCLDPPESGGCTHQSHQSLASV